MNLVDDLIKGGWLKTERIIEAFRKIKRVDFLPKGMENLAELNEALPIGEGQTISQPLVVAFMLELLQPVAGDKILDIGFGSGWTSTLLGQIVGEKGKIVAIEIIPQIAQFGQNNIAKYNFIEKGIVECLVADGSKGYEKEAPYDKILASASAERLPYSWKEQLKIGGRIVVPIRNSIWLFEKKENNTFDEKEYPGFVFVPLIEN